MGDRRKPIYHAYTVDVADEVTAKKMSTSPVSQ